jgi:hypothetical protein
MRIAGPTGLAKGKGRLGPEDVALPGGAAWCPSSSDRSRAVGRCRRTLPAANATRARAPVAIEHVFAAQKCRLGLIIRSVCSPVPPPGSGSPTSSPTPARLIRNPAGAGLTRISHSG